MIEAFPEPGMLTSILSIAISVQSNAFHVAQVIKHDEHLAETPGILSPLMQ